MNLNLDSIKKVAEILRLIFYVSLTALAVAGNALFDEHSRKIAFFGLLSLFTFGVAGGAFVKMQQNTGFKKFVFFITSFLFTLFSFFLFSITAFGIFG